MKNWKKNSFAFILLLLFFLITGFAPAKMLVNEETGLKALPALKSQDLGTVQAGEVLRVTGETANGWYQVLRGETAGYVRTKYMTPIEWKVNALGDSITNGICVFDKNNLYYNVAASLCGAAQVRGYGANGVSIAGLMPDNLADRSLAMDRDANLILVLGGTNDFYFSVPLGTNEDRTYDTFYGAMHVLCTRLRAAYPEADIVFMTPLKRCDEFGEYNALGLTLEQYAGVIAKVCAQYGFPVIDTYHEPTMDFTVMPGVYLPDGLHPDDASHLSLGYYVAEKLKELGIVY